MLSRSPGRTKRTLREERMEWKWGEKCGLEELFNLWEKESKSELLESKNGSENESKNENGVSE